MNIKEYTRDTYVISTNPKKIDVDLVHDFLSHSYWSEDIPKEILARSIMHSLCFGVYEGKHQVGFARVITDYATFAYLADVYILESHRGKGLGTWLMSCIISHPDLQGFRRWVLATRDAHKLYEKFKFTPLNYPERFMELFTPNIYKKK